MRSLFRSAGSFTLTEALFLRALGFIYLFAFGSLASQVVGLFGSRGIVPIFRTLAEARQVYGPSAPALMPSIFWLNASDGMLVGACVAGCIAGLMAVFGLFSRLALALSWILYLSITAVGAPFTNFQWDALLLETGFLALWSGGPLLVWAYRFLLFRLTFESGLVKWQSGDVSWHSLSALRFHFYTQPLPTPLAYWAARLPDGALKALTAATLVIEVFVPFFLFLPRWPRLVATALLALLQVCILLTGNYGFFNLLTLALCLWGLDDRTLQPVGQALRSWIVWPRLTHSPAWRIASSVIILIVMLLGALEVTGSTAFARLRRSLAPYDIVNTYGLFAVMTTARQEIILEGSSDAEHWQPYEFPFKPGDPHRSLPVVTPRMPRLDWQMWFAALSDFNQSHWVGALMYRLLTSEPSVRALLLPQGPQPTPKYMRALVYSYRFTTPAERTRTGDVWHRELTGTWFGPVSLTGR